MQKFVKPLHVDEDYKRIKITNKDILGMIVILFALMIVFGILWLMIGGFLALCKIIYLVLFTM